MHRTEGRIAHWRSLQGAFPCRSRPAMLAHMAPRAFVPLELRSGPFTLAEADRVGVSWRQLQGKSWRRLGPGVYCWRGLPAEPLLTLQAVALRLPGNAVFSGLTAARLHKVDVLLGDSVEVTVPLSSSLTGIRGVTVHRADLQPDDIQAVGCLRATSPIRTAFDVSRRLPLVEAVVVVDAMLHAGKVDESQLQSALAELTGRKGATPFRKVIQLSEPRTESPMESRLRLGLILGGGGLPRPEAQVNLHDEFGRWIARVDLFYREARVCIEFDGGGHRETLIEDNRRQNLLIKAGYIVLRFTAADVYRNLEVVVQQVRAALMSRLEGRTDLSRRLDRAI